MMYKILLTSGYTCFLVLIAICVLNMFNAHIPHLLVLLLYITLAVPTIIFIINTYILIWKD